MSEHTDSSSQLPGAPGTGGILGDEAYRPRLFLRAQKATFSCIQGFALTVLKQGKWGKKEMRIRIYTEFCPDI